MPGRTQSEVIDSIANHAMRVLRGYENEDIGALVLAYRKAQDSIVGDIDAMFRREMFDVPGQWSMAEMAAANRKGALFNEIDRRLIQLRDESNIRIENAGVRQFNDSTMRSAYGLDQATPPNYFAKVPVLPVDQIRAFLAEPFQGAMFSQRIGLITDEMATGIKQQLTQSMINGESMTQAAGRVEKIIGVSDMTSAKSITNRAVTIARSEIIRASELGNMATYYANDEVLEGDPDDTASWVATGDDRLCKWCLRRDGKTLAQIRKMPTKGDPWGNKTERPLHPKCRCRTKPKMKTWRDMGIDMPEDFGDQDRGMRDEVTKKWKIVPSETFDKWKERRAVELGVAV